MDEVYDGETLSSGQGSQRRHAFEPWIGGAGVDIAGAYSRAVWRPRLGGWIWDLWAALGARLGTGGPFECCLGELAPVGHEALAAQALVELSSRGLVRTAGENRWEVRVTCPVPAPTPTPGDKAGTARHYEALAAQAQRDRWKRDRLVRVAVALRPRVAELTGRRASRDRAERSSDVCGDRRTSAAHTTIRRLGA